MPQNLALVLVCLTLLTACTSTPTLRANPSACQALQARGASFDPSSGDALAALDQVSDLAEAGCHREAIELGQEVRRAFREKDYSITAETFSVFLPEDALAEYVLESFERAFLSFVIASSYLKLGQKDDAAVELRRSYNEGKALLYNYGEDPVNALLIAALWDRLDVPDSARPFWKKLTSMLDSQDPIHRLAARRIAEIDRGVRAHWRIFGLGRFPELDWSFGDGHGSYFKLEEKGDAAHSCRSPTGAVLSTHAWVEKIGHRYASDYHPLLHLKSWVRMPIGIVYGVGTFTAGLGMAVGGCALDGALTGKSGSFHPLCEASVRTGIGLMAESPNVTRYALRPDLRHWRRLPAAIMITTEKDFSSERCWREQAAPVLNANQNFVD